MNDFMVRLSRLRANEALRAMVRENVLSVDDLVAPLFVHNEENVKREITSMPGQFQLSGEYLADQAR